MINISGKVNKDNYKEFINSDFFGYEIYLGPEDDFKYLSEMTRQLNIISVHQPSEDFNLCSGEEIGRKSFDIMFKMLSALNDSNYKRIVVVHGALFDETTSSKEKYLRILAERVDKLAEFFPEIKITLETDILFFNQILNNRALLTSPRDFILLKKYLKSKLYITLDFEHAVLSSMFKNFISKNKQYYVEISNLADLKKPESLKAKVAWFNYLKKYKDNFDEIMQTAFKEYERLKTSIIHFHLSPSNMLAYWFDKKKFLPLAGEHLNVKEKGDKLNYKLIMDCLSDLTESDPINLVLEIWPRENGRYVPELKKSGKLIKKYVRQ